MAEAKHGRGARAPEGTREGRAAQAAPPAPAVVVQGTLDRITYRDPETWFTVARLASDGGEPVTIVGRLFEVHEGEWLRVEGAYEVDRNYGRQLRVSGYEAATPTTALGIQRYLGAGLVKGVGEELARRIVARFGAETFQVLETAPERLFEVEGIGKKRHQRLVGAWSEHRAQRRVLVFLRGHGIGAAHAARIVKAYGDAAIERVTKNPYRLADDIWGIGFHTADRIGRSLGMAVDAPERADAGVRHALARASDEGHVCQERGALTERAVELLDVPHEAIDAAIDRLRAGGLVIEEGWPAATATAASAASPVASAAAPLASAAAVASPGAPSASAARTLASGADGPGDGAGGRAAAPGAAAAGAPPHEARWLWLRHLYTAEATLALSLARLSKSRSGLPPIQVERAIAWAEERRKLRLAPSQRAALATTLGSKVAVMTGGPGVGKTTIVGALLDILEAKRVRVRLAAPTGRAAKRLADSTGREALTIHRLLRWNPRAQDFEHSADQPLEECDVLVVDETSMVDIVLMHRLVAALPLAAHLVLVGDADQLPSVGPGAVLEGLIASGALPVARLTEVHRQAEGSRIVRGAHAVLRGEPPDAAPPWHASDLHFVDAATPEETLAAVERLVARDLPQRFGLDAVRDIQVLAPMHRGTAGIAALNRALTEALGGRGAAAASGAGGAGGALEVRGRRFAPGTKVMQQKNSYDREVWNGDVGVVSRIDPDEGELWVRFDDEREVRYASGDLDELELAYAVSIHKAQGSEYPCVVVPLVTEHYLLLRRQLLYTAMTRARRHLVLVGQRRALHIAVRQSGGAGRASFLGQRLARALAGSA